MDTISPPPRLDKSVCRKILRLFSSRYSPAALRHTWPNSTPTSGNTCKRSVSAECWCSRVAVGAQDVLFRFLLAGIDNPVFRHTGPLVQLPLERAVQLLAGVGKHFDDQVGGSFALFRGDDFPVFFQDQHQVRLYDVVRGKFHVDG